MSQEIEKPPSKLWLHELSDLLGWYQQNLCAAHLEDPRGHVLVFSLERFPHLIKLLRKDSDNEVSEPQKHVARIRSGQSRNGDYGGYDQERAQTLSWIPAMIARPTMIVEVVERTLWEKPGDTVYLKQFNKGGYPFKALVCRRVGKERLAPITCHPRSNGRVSKAYKIVWSPETAKTTTE
jgi:hypothetical protein